MTRRLRVAGTRRAARALGPAGRNGPARGPTGGSAGAGVGPLALAGRRGARHGAVTAAQPGTIGSSTVGSSTVGSSTGDSSTGDSGTGETEPGTAIRAPPGAAVGRELGQQRRAQ